MVFGDVCIPADGGGLRECKARLRERLLRFLASASSKILSTLYEVLMKPF